MARMLVLIFMAALPTNRALEGVKASVKFLTHRASGGHSETHGKTYPTAAGLAPTEASSSYGVRQLQASQQNCHCEVQQAVPYCCQVQQQFLREIQLNQELAAKESMKTQQAVQEARNNSMLLLSLKERKWSQELISKAAAAAREAAAKARALEEIHLAQVARTVSKNLLEQAAKRVDDQEKSREVAAPLADAKRQVEVAQDTSAVQAATVMAVDNIAASSYNLLTETAKAASARTTANRAAFDARVSAASAAQKAIEAAFDKATVASAGRLAAQLDKTYRQKESEAAWLSKVAQEDVGRAAEARNAFMASLQRALGTKEIAIAATAEAAGDFNREISKAIMDLQEMFVGAQDAVNEATAHYKAQSAITAPSIFPPPRPLELVPMNGPVVVPGPVAGPVVVPVSPIMAPVSGLVL